MTVIHERRESFFRCTFNTGGLERIGHVRAWDAEEAESLFRAELDADGVSYTDGPMDVVRLDVRIPTVASAARARVARRRARRLHS